MKRERRRLAIAALDSMTGLLSTCVRAEQTPPQESPVEIAVTGNTGSLAPESSKASKLRQKTRGWRGF
jgi:hypothetical protein